MQIPSAPAPRGFCPAAPAGDCGGEGKRKWDRGPAARQLIGNKRVTFFFR